MTAKEKNILEENHLASALFLARDLTISSVLSKPDVVHSATAEHASSISGGYLCCMNINTTPHYRPGPAFVTSIFRSDPTN